jgi:peptidoglycan/LPS O-acetylase OafA/YrhL
VFFVISGFVLYRPFAAARFNATPAPPLVPYAVRRVARIVPAYWVALAIVSVLLSEHYVHTIGGALRYFGFAQLYGGWNTVVSGGIAPAWTLCVEVTFYASLPLLALAIRRLASGRGFLRSEMAFCGGLIFGGLVWQLVVLLRVPVDNVWQLPLLGMLPGSIDLFAFGMALAALSVAYQNGLRPPWLRAVERLPWLLWLLALGAFFAIGELGSLAGSHFTVWWLITHELKAIGSVLLLAPLVIGSTRRDLLRRILGSRPLLYLGSISYGIYLWHYPLLQRWRPTFVHHGEWFTFLVLSAVTVAVASASFYLIERPAQRLARRYLSSRSSRLTDAPVAPSLGA